MNRTEAWLQRQYRTIRGKAGKIEKAVGDEIGVIKGNLNPKPIKFDRPKGVNYVGTKPKVNDTPFYRNNDIFGTPLKPKKKAK